MKNKIILKAEGELEDLGAREWLSQLQRKVDNINERTKRQTIEIRELKSKGKS